MNFHALRTIAALTLLACLTLTGCANVQPPVPLDHQFWDAKEPTIGVAITVVPPMRWALFAASRPFLPISAPKPDSAPSRM